jgi:hypothetical protein
VVLKLFLKKFQPLSLEKYQHLCKVLLAQSLPIVKFYLWLKYLHNFQNHPVHYNSDIFLTCDTDESFKYFHLKSKWLKDLVAFSKFFENMKMRVASSFCLFNEKIENAVLKNNYVKKFINIFRNLFELF